MQEEKELMEKIREVQTELRVKGLWRAACPGWVTDFAKKEIRSEHEFTEWLQFVYLPNLLHPVTPAQHIRRHDVALQAIKYFGDDMEKGHLLRLLIELDALS